MGYAKGSKKRRARQRRDGPEPVDVHVGKKIREARLMRGLNQTEFGDAIGTSFQAIQKYESAHNRISASRLFRASQVLGLPVPAFFEDDAAGGGVAYFANDELALVRAFREISSEGVRDSLAQLIKSLSMVSRRRE